MPWPGSCLAMSSVYVADVRELDREAERRRRRAVSPLARAVGVEVLGDRRRRPAAVAGHPVRQDSTTAEPVGRLAQQQLQPDVAAGDRQDAVRRAVGRVGQRDGAVPQRLARRVADDQVRRGPEPVLVERVARRPRAGR